MGEFKNIPTTFTTFFQYQTLSGAVVVICFVKHISHIIYLLIRSIVCIVRINSSEVSWNGYRCASAKSFTFATATQSPLFYTTAIVPHRLPNSRCQSCKESLVPRGQRKYIVLMYLNVTLVSNCTMFRIQTVGNKWTTCEQQSVM